MTMEQAWQTIFEDSADPLSFDYRWHTAIHGFLEWAAVLRVWAFPVPLLLGGGLTIA